MAPTRPRWSLAAVGAVAMLVLATASPSGHDRARAAPGSPPKLYLAGDGELWAVNVARESVRHLDYPELAPGDAPYRLVSRGDRLVGWSYRTLVLDPNRLQHP